MTTMVIMMMMVLIIIMKNHFRTPLSKLNLNFQI